MVGGRLKCARDFFGIVFFRARSVVLLAHVLRAGNARATRNPESHNVMNEIHNHSTNWQPAPTACQTQKISSKEQGIEQKQRHSLFERAITVHSHNNRL